MPDFGRVSQIDASAFDDGTAYVSVRRPLLDDRAPYIFRSADYGATWTKITNGIGDGRLRARRARGPQPSRAALRGYAARRCGLLRRRCEWSDLSLNLPDVPVADLIVEENALVIGTHGRSFWVLDNITALRQWSPTLSAAATHLYTPVPAMRSTAGASLSYTLAAPAQRATLELLDSANVVLRQFSIDTTVADTSGAAAPTGRRGGGPTWLPNAAGLNEFTWDLRTEPIVGFPGMILWGARLTGPAVPPGRYTARLTVDGKVMSAPLEVRRNSLITDVTDADLHKQYQFGRQVRDKATEANLAVIAIRNVKRQVTHRLAASDDGGLKRDADRMVTKLSDVEQKIYQVKNQSGQDPLNYPIRVNNRLANLLSMSERGDGPPGTYMPEIFGILVEELAGYTAEMDNIMATDLKALNERLGALGLAPIDAECDKEAGCAGIAA
jgi:hypothetical protein